MSEILTEKVMIEGLTVTNIIWRKFRRQPAGFLEKVLDLNPGLCDAVTVPVGTAIAFPVEDVSETDTKRSNVVRLWD